MKRTRRRTRGIDKQTETRFAFLLERLSQADPDQVPDVSAILGRLAAKHLPQVADTLIDALCAEVNESAPAYARRLSASVRDLEAGLRAVRQTRRILRGAGATLFAQVALAEVEADLRQQIQTSPFVAAAKRYRAKIGTPSKDAGSYVARLRACGASRDESRELLRAVRVAAVYSWPSHSPRGARVRFVVPSLLALVQRRAAEK